MRAKKVDDNHREIVKELRECGFSVQSISGDGNGVPDIIVGHDGVNYLFEIKLPKGRLNKIQLEWHSSWNGSVSVIRSSEDAKDVIYGRRKKEEPN